MVSIGQGNFDGFVKVNALRLRTLAKWEKKAAASE
jgi:hypothetical protein